jgi:hypothetical protein
MWDATDAGVEGEWDREQGGVGEDCVRECGAVVWVEVGRWAGGGEVVENNTTNE